ncbi:hypothetical protein GCM10027423_02220 [Spirosoma arcticum]
MIVLGGEDGPIEFIYPERLERLQNGVFLLGQTTSTLWMNVGSAQVYMVVLKPTALPFLLGESASVLTDTTIRVDDRLPECRFLAEQLVAQRSQFAQIDLLDTVLRRLFRNAVAHPGEIDSVWNYIIQTQGRVKMGELSVRERISTRSLTRKFTEQVGMSPKQYAQIIRFRAVMNHLLTTPGVSWLDIIHQFGYYDQSHVIKDFQQITGYSPTQYLLVDQSIDGSIIKTLSAS